MVRDRGLDLNAERHFSKGVVTMSTAKDTVILKRTIVCVKCKKSVDVRPSDVLRFTASGWPECCGVTMKYDAPVLPPPPPITPVSAFLLYRKSQLSSHR
jgi:hypothetical protein